MKEYRSAIKKLEAHIFAITGKNNEIYNHWADDEEKRKRVIELLIRRHTIIEDVFFPVSAEEDKRLRSVNKKLKELTNSLIKKSKKLVIKNLNERQPDEEFVVEASLKHIYRGEDSVLKLDDDRVYCSNFTLIIKVLTELYAALQKDSNFVIKIDNEEHFSTIDKNNYSERLSQIMKSFYGPISDFWKSYMAVTICYATQDFVSNKLYSGADLIRINEFRQEFNVTHKFTHRQSDESDLRQ